MADQIRVLIVEDSATQAAVIAELVEGLGFCPIVYTELPVGITQILSKEKPNLVLLDLRLVDNSGKQFADGFHVCREIKRIDPSLPVIIVTSEGDDEACQWAFLQGANAYLQKPFVATEFAKVVEQVLGNVATNAAKA